MGAQIFQGIEPHIPSFPHRADQDSALSSAYVAVQGREPPQTNNVEINVEENHVAFRDTLDYVFYSKGLTPIMVLEVDETSASPLPSLEHPSDHVPVGATFTLGPAE